MKPLIPDEQQHPARWWHREGNRFRCVLCPRKCLLSAGQRAFCFVRAATDDGIVLTTYGRSSGFVVDPMEKKPLNHFFPGASAFSLGTAGCNLGCRYCQNWDISSARNFDRLADSATPYEIAEKATALGCTGVAFTYNDPIVFAEYAIDTAVECRLRGLHPIAVTNAFITAEARPDFFAAMDAAAIDLKAFSPEFYRKICYGDLDPVLETIEYVVKETSCWVELTTLVIPGHNDGERELDELTCWVADTLGHDVPLHFSAFHPDYKMRSTPPTPLATLQRAREIGIKNGLHYVYTGNVVDWEGRNTWCPGCSGLVIERKGYAIAQYHLDEHGKCRACAHPIAGHFGRSPKHWGNRFEPVPMHLQER